MATAKRVSKEIKDTNDIDTLLALTEKDITMSLIMNLFGDFGKYQKFNPYDLITVPAGRYGGPIPNGSTKTNKAPFTTTVGRLIFNKYFIECEPELLQLLGYVNDNVGKKTYGKLFDTLVYAIL